MTSSGFYKEYDGHRVDVKIIEADVEKGRPNAIASMVLIYTQFPQTRYKDVYLKAAAQESGCIPLEETLVIGRGGYVEVDCG